MEKLILIIAIVIISLLHIWWKKRNGEGDEDAAPWSGQPQRRPPVAPPASRPSGPSPTKASNWEDELRRLLQGEDPARPVPPPIVVQQAPPPLPGAIPPRPAAQRPAPMPRPEPVAQVDSDMGSGWSAQRPSMVESAQAFLHGSMAESQLAGHIQREHSEVAIRPIFELKKKASPEIRQAVALVRNRQSQRVAIIAGIILGPSKAMEG